MIAAQRIFVGRERELSELTAALEQARAGRGGLLLVVGEPGIGKTRLADELAARAASSGVSVLWGRCWDAEGRPPYWPWVQIFRALMRQCPPSSFAGADAALIAEVAQLVPELRSAPTSLVAAPESDTVRFRLFDAATTYVKRAAAQAPLVLIIDDLHAADIPSLRLLEFLVRDLNDACTLVLAMYRPVEARQEPAMAEVLGALGRAGSHLMLAGLSEQEVGMFIERAAGEAAPDDLVQYIHRQTDGNPFFVDEVVRLLQTRPVVERWVVPESPRLPITQGVRGAIRERLGPFGLECRRLLAAAAVLGREFDLSLLALLCETSVEAILEQLEPPLAREVIGSAPGTPGRYRFTHALIRETVYEELPPVERVRLHRAFGLIIEERYRHNLEPHIPALAHHFFEATAAGDGSKAIDYAERAARQAMTMLAYEQAAAQYERALRLLELSGTADPRRQCELLLAMGDAFNRAGQEQDAAQVLRRAMALARQLDAPALLAGAAIRWCDLTGLFWTEFGRVDNELIRVLEEALTAVGEQEPVMRSRVMARLATETCWTSEPHRSELLSREALALARQTGDPVALAYTLLGRVLCRSGPEHIDERAALVDEILLLTEQTGDREVFVNALMWRLGDALQMNALAVVRATTAVLIREVKELRRPADQWIIPTVESQGALIEGRFADAERLAGAIVARPTRVTNAVQISSAALYLVRREHGGLTDLEAPLKSLIVQYPDVTVWRASLALLYADLGRVPEARTEFDNMTRGGLDAIRRDVAWLYTMACLAEAGSLASTAAGVAPLYAALLPYADRNIVAGPLYYLGPVSHYLGLLAARMTRWDDAERHFDAALTQAMSIDAAPYAARILTAHARMRLTRRASGDADAAAALLRRARTIATPLRMNALIEHMQNLLVAAPESSVTPADTGNPRGTPATFRREGDFWTVAYEDRVQRLRDVKGLAYIARLLQEPSREFHVLDLVSLINDDADTLRERVAADRAWGSARGEEALLDRRAKREVGNRLADLRAEVEQAEQCNDFHRAAAIRSEIDAITEQLAAAVGLGGRDRRMRAASEKARASVTKAIRTAIALVRKNDPSLARVLALTIKTGTFCSYQPVAELPVAWDV